MTTNTIIMIALPLRGRFLPVAVRKNKMIIPTRGMIILPRIVYE